MWVRGEGLEISFRRLSAPRGTCGNLQVPIEHVSAVLRTLGILSGVYTLDFGKSFRCDFDGTSFHFSPERDEEE